MTQIFHFSSDLFEEWKCVPDSTLLWASSDGRIRSDEYWQVQPNGGGYYRSLAPTYGYWVKTSKNCGRLIVRFKGKTYKVAVLVCSAFKGVRPQGHVVSHLDEDATNNSQDNLEWTTQKKNLNMPKVKEYHRICCRTKMAGETVDVSETD